MCSADIKLFVCCHQPVEVPKHPLLVPVQVGTALVETPFPGFLHDNTGDNISGRNHSYCELTAQYWAWKNLRADYYGFFHYRRYLYPCLDTKRPYCIRQNPSLSLLEQLDYDSFPQIIEGHDMILPKGENMYLSVRDHYAGASNHFCKDLDLVSEIIRSSYPQMWDALDQYLSGSICYFGNIYIMNRSVFHDYCKWLFPILEEFDRYSQVSGRTPQEQRVDGYLAERLLGIYYTYRNDCLETLELPRVHFTMDSRKQYKAERAVYMLLPPGTRRRAWTKSLLQAVRSSK